MKFYDRHCEKFAAYYPEIEKRFGKYAKAFSLFNKASTAVVYVVYITLFVIICIKGDIPCAVRYVAIPMAVFLLVTAMRIVIKAPRPYEKFPIHPLVHKSTKGKSCPSRHSACAFIIALACLYVNIPCGIIMLVIALLITASRPIMGVHFPLDVIAGAGTAILLGVPLFWCI